LEDSKRNVGAITSPAVEVAGGGAKSRSESLSGAKGEASKPKANGNLKRLSSDDSGYRWQAMNSRQDADAAPEGVGQSR
jgi:hypothetical protein